MDASKRAITAFGLNSPEAKPICITFLKSVFARSFNSSLAISLNTLMASEAFLYKLSTDVPIALLKFSLDIWPDSLTTSFMVCWFALFKLSKPIFLWSSISLISFSVFAFLSFKSYCWFNASTSCWFWTIASSPSWMLAASSFAFADFALFWSYAAFTIAPLLNKASTAAAGRPTPVAANPPAAARPATPPPVAARPPPVTSRFLLFCAWSNVVCKFVAESFLIANAIWSGSLVKFSPFGPNKDTSSPLIINGIS